MPTFHLHWHVQHGAQQMMAKKDVVWDFVPCPGAAVIPFEGGASVLITAVDIALSGTEVHIALEPYTEANGERYDRLQSRLSAAEWKLEP